MISIIIPVYNVEKYLPQCVDSILAQTYKDFELILVDDGSPDNSGAICDEYAQRNSCIRVIHQENAGVSAARNNGIEHANGEWINFIDSDDFVDSDYLDNFHLNGNDADIIIQGLVYYNHRTNSYFKKVSHEDIILDCVNFKSVIAENKVLSSGYPCAKAIKKSLLYEHSLRFDTTLSFHEDHIFVLQVLNVCKKIQLSSSTAYKYRYYHTNSSLSSRHYPWQKHNAAANGMICQLDIIKDMFLVADSVYSEEIFTFSYSSKISAVFDLFRSSLSSRELKVFYNTIINRMDLRNLYNPTGIKWLVIKGIMLYTPFFFIKIFFRSYISYQDRNK